MLDTGFKIQDSRYRIPDARDRKMLFLKYCHRYTVSPKQIKLPVKSESFYKIYLIPEYLAG
jgi:hypothetical protein